jgi:hypothetical protein
MPWQELVVVILYHFTFAERLPGIRERGLVPHVPEPNYLTMGKPVVWLTRRVDDVAWTGAKKLADLSSDVRLLAVRIDPNDRQLGNYVTWMRGLRGMSARLDNGRVMTGAQILEFCLPEMPKDILADWYVYLGTIPLARIVCRALN